MFLELIELVALLLSLAFLYAIVIHTVKTSRQQQIVGGSIFGIICIIGMGLAVELAPGILVDPRSLILSMATVFTGFIGGLITLIFAVVYRIWVGGAGTFLGIILMLWAAGAGLVLGYLVNRQSIQLNLVSLFAFGLIVQLGHLGLAFFLPEPTSTLFLETLTLPILLTFTPGTAAIGWLMLTTKNEFESNQKLRELSQQKAKALEQIITVLSAALEERDHYTAGHQKKVATIAVLLGEELGLDSKRLEGLRLGALVHDIGKIGVPLEILTKSERLTDEEFEIIKTHPERGAKLLKSVQFEWPLAEFIRQHHERVDGTGYPDKLTGLHISLEARIVAVADTIDAMATDRPYRKGLGLDAAITELKNTRGSKYDREVVDAALKRVDDIKGILEHPEQL